MRHLPLANRQPRSAPRRRGAALLIVLWAVVLLSIILTNFAIQAGTQARVVSNAANEVQLKTIAEAGVERAIASLKLDERHTDSAADEWHENPEAFEAVAIGDGTFTLKAHDNRPEGFRPGLEDEASKLNLRTATQEKLQALGGLSPAQIQGLLDWQDGDEDAHPLGAESATYRGNPALPHPSRNKPLTTLAEMKLVNGFDPSTLWGEDWNGNGILDPAENDGEENLPPDNRDGVLDRGILHLVTVWSSDAEKSPDGQDRVNINEASEQELKARITGLTDEEAKAIVEHRGENRFEKVGQLLRVKKPKTQEQQTTQEQGQQAAQDQGRQRGEGQGTTQAGQEQPAQSSASRQSSDQPREDMFTRDRVKQIIGQCRVGNDAAKAGRININTAPARVLRTVAGINEERAQAIVAAREGGRVFESIADLLDVGGISEDNFIEASEEVTVKSDQFLARSEARIEGVKRLVTVSAVIDRSGETITLKYWNVE